MMKCSVVLALAFLMVINGISGVPTRSKESEAKEEASSDAATKIERTAEDDSDMLMEPDEFHDTSIIPAVLFAHHTTHAAESGFHPIVNPEYTTLSYPSPSSSSPPSSSLEADAPASEAQNYFQSYFRNTVPPLGHSRPYFSAGHHRGEGSSGSRFSSLRSVGNFDQSILGSGDFGVIRGGTFYGENDPPFRDSGDYYNYFHKNGHQRPHAATYVQRYTYPEEQFANFRDFADINSPSDSAYSQFVVVYANKNSTEAHPNPKNIFEQLELLDKAEEKKNKEMRYTTNGRQSLEKEKKRKL
ncbi:uncharacterized protein LOC129805281 isoform X3 [Phlebotomus papatasi]|uniref:uncharacterized protein LOC129805281 isoform X3 n=1 Tax=Phlebotomus papatasi TaxID=29031 RepID=UPI0024845720|nr:uncharacterized protein LOC129805281 isoform X3 [Phlebotomus papatasi]